MFLVASRGLPSPLGHSCSLLIGPLVPEPIATRRTRSGSSISPRALGFLMGDGSREEPAVSRLADGSPQKPALGFSSLLQIPDKIQNSLKVHFGRFLKKDGAGRRLNAEMSSEMGKQSCSPAAEVSLDRQLQAWRNNPTWTDEPPEIKVTVPEGSLCNLNLRFKAGLPPDAVYNIIIDPENKQVFKNIKEVISRKVLLDEGVRQVVEVEQAAIWKFLWWSGILS
ncbi:unnamed protein product, partial [Urochloa humidicola]